VRGCQGAFASGTLRAKRVAAKRGTTQRQTADATFGSVLLRQSTLTWPHTLAMARK
jgi:hypothetical protein